jgi:hypothetical protein
MPYTKINAQVAPADVTAIKAAFALVQQKLPFLLTLTDAERKALRKVGPERLSFVVNAAQVAANNPTSLPASFDAAGFQLAVGLFTVLTDLNTVAAQLASQLDDTHMDVGVQALEGASDVYGYVQTAAKKTPGLKPAADQLGQLYAKAAATRRANNKVQAAKTEPKKPS